MLTLYILAEHDKIFFYQRKENEFFNQYIEGNEHLDYSVGTLENDIEKIINLLLEEFNLTSPNEIELYIISDRKNYCSEMFINALQKSSVEILKVFDLGKLLFDVLKVHYDNSGINFDGKNYVISDNKITQKNFSLVAETLTEKKLMSLLHEQNFNSACVSTQYRR